VKSAVKDKENIFDRGLPSAGFARNPTAKAQRREGAKNANEFLCAFASLRLCG
jgi:hypothetical protein